ncbi:Antitoxin HigA (plasmid) [Piscirickettsia salmonis]|uniref:helix-turn-helix domain-containing protein n=1 Tax=Piscirickettsia salmonis TaxID=1238 RepID=UPI0012B9849B|nr:helix-turn-helix domain-containing protein [Piscirickettsia salmonis]QGP52105.1 Antitoxin HigA [Piscirickettsia salmonis]
MKLKPIHTEQDYEEALAEVDKLFDAKPGTAKGDKLEILVTLIEAYEAKEYPISDPSPIDYLVYLMESRGMSRQELGDYLGGKSRVSEILNGKRDLTLSMIRRLHFDLGVSADLLISPVAISEANKGMGSRKPG